MRVIAGSAGGLQLKSPDGMGTRPMTDKIKGSLFNILANLGFPQEGDRVLDLFAGTGSLGIEALSRGASWGDFVEQNGKVAAIVGANLATTGFAEQGQLHQTSVSAFLSRSAALAGAEPYDIIFLDPPYAAPDIIEILQRVASGHLLHESGIIVIGHATQVEPGDTLGELVRVRHRVFGGSAFSLYRRPEAEHDAPENDDESGE